MRGPKFSGILKSERGITRGPYSGYLLVALIALAVITLLVYLSGNRSFLDGFQQILVFSAMALSYDYFSGYTGYYNLGFGAFVALGAYVFVFSSNAGVPIPIAMFFGGVLTSIFALAMSYPFLRLKGAYFAIATFALILLLEIFDTNFYQYTGGTAGIQFNYPTAPLRTPLFFGSLLVTLAVLYFHYSLGKSRLGLALRSIKEEEEVTESFGVNAFRAKQTAMVLSAFFGGISGGLFALYLGFINVDNVMGIGVALFPVVAALAGGSGIFLGPLVGSFILIIVRLNLPELVSSIDPSITAGPLVITGIILILVGLLFPGGILRINYFLKFAYQQMDEKILAKLGR